MNARHDIQDRLAAVRRRWLAHDVLRAASWCALAVLPVVVVLVLADWRFDLPRWWRAAQWVALIVLAAAGLRRLLPSVVTRRDAYRAALRVEARFAELGGALVSCVQLGEQPGAGQSCTLVDALCEHVRARTERLPCRDAVSLKDVRLPLVGALVAAAIAVGLTARQPALASIGVSRLLAPWTHAAWPKRTHVALDRDAYRVRRGDTLIVRGTITGRVPATARLGWRSATGATHGEVEVDVPRDGACEARLGPLLEPVEVRLIAGDDVTAYCPVHVVTPPELASVRARYVPPAYSHRMPEEVLAGDVRALVGTRVELTLTADRPVARAELAFTQQGGARDVVPVALRDETHGEATFDVRFRGRYEVRLIDGYGFATDAPATFTIDPIENEAPTVRIVRPRPEHAVTPFTRLRIQYDANDDFGVAGAAIRWSKGGAEPSAVPIALDASGPHVSAYAAWDLAGLALQPGDEVRYEMVVRDEGEHLAAEPIGRSREHVLKVVTPEHLRGALERQLRDAFADLSQAAQQQSASLDATTALVVSLSAGEAAGDTDPVGRLRTEESRQQRVRREIERIAERIEETTADMEDSAFGEARDHAAMRALAAELRRVAAGPVDRIAERLRAARELLATTPAHTGEAAP